MLTTIYKSELHYRNMATRRQFSISTGIKSEHELTWFGLVWLRLFSIGFAVQLSVEGVVIAKRSKITKLVFCVSGLIGRVTNLSNKLAIFIEP